MEQTAQNLEVLEQRAESALEKAETGWRQFAQAMREIKESEAHKEAGYHHFQTYYRERWESQTGRTFRAYDTILERLRSIEEFEEAAQGLARERDLPGGQAARILRANLPDPYERVEAWDHHLASGRETGRNREGLRESIREYKGGVIEQLEDAGAEIPPYPEGPSDEEVAYRKVSDLAAVAKDVTPEAAARAVSSSTAYSVAPNYDFLLPWIRSFLAELHIRAGR